MTMVEPVHLLLFGSSSVVSHGNGVVKLDEWSVNQQYKSVPFFNMFIAIIHVGFLF